MIDRQLQAGSAVRRLSSRVVAVAIACALTLGPLLSACQAEESGSESRSGASQDRLESLDGVDSVDVHEDDPLQTTVTVTMAEDATESQYVAALDELQYYADVASTLIVGRVAHPDTKGDDLVGVRFIGPWVQDSSPEEQVDWLFRGLELFPDGRPNVDDGTFYARFKRPEQVGPAIRSMTTDPVLSDLDSGYVGFSANPNHHRGISINAELDNEVATVWDGALASVSAFDTSSSHLFIHFDRVSDEAQWLVDFCIEHLDSPAPLAQHRHDLLPAVRQLLDLLVHRDAELSVGGCVGPAIISMESSRDSVSLDGPKDWVRWSAAHVTRLGVDVL